MVIQILGAESLGVRGLCCHVRTGDRKILIDPGVALGYIRHKLLPHPEQVAIAEKVRQKIIDLWQDATDIVFSHFHGDHVPLADANPYQLSIGALAGLNGRTRIWCKNQNHLSHTEALRKKSLSSALGLDILPGENKRQGPLHFSRAVPHGDPEITDDTVMMTLIEEDRRFLHAPDIQLLCDQTVSRILDWEPDVLLAGGPPLYLFKLTNRQIDQAWQNAVKLARGVDQLILDHHLMRSTEGLTWLKDLTTASGRPVMCAADFMGKKRRLMEANRERLYRSHPVSGDWHENYAEGKATTEDYR